MKTTRSHLTGRGVNGVLRWQPGDKLLDIATLGSGCRSKEHVEALRALGLKLANRLGYADTARKRRVFNDYGWQKKPVVVEKSAPAVVFISEDRRALFDRLCRKAA